MTLSRCPVFTKSRTFTATHQRDVLPQTTVRGKHNGNGVRLTLGFDTRAARQAMKSRGFRMMWVVSPRYGDFSDAAGTGFLPLQSPAPGCRVLLRPTASDRIRHRRPHPARDHGRRQYAVRLPAREQRGRGGSFGTNLLRQQISLGSATSIDAGRETGSHRTSAPFPSTGRWK
jgi:hypothetical protein